MFKYFIFTEAAFFYSSMTTEGCHRFSCLEEEGEVRGIQLQHAISPLDVTKFYTLNLKVS